MCTWISVRQRSEFTIALFYSSCNCINCNAWILFQIFNITRYNYIWWRNYFQNFNLCTGHYLFRNLKIYMQLPWCLNFFNVAMKRLSNSPWKIVLRYIIHIDCILIFLMKFIRNSCRTWYINGVNILTELLSLRLWSAAEM